MTYKIGNTVKLKSAEELMKLNGWNNERAKELGGRAYKIDDFSANGYWSGNMTFTDKDIKCLADEQEGTYTFDELKKRVDELKKFLLEYTTDTRQIVEVQLQTSEYCMGYNVNSKIEITD